MNAHSPHPPSGLDVTEGGSRDDQPGRPWIQVWFRCAGRYLRVFRHHDGSGYMARCSSCGKCIRFRTGAGGTQQRRFDVDCRA